MGMGNGNGKCVIDVGNNVFDSLSYHLGGDENVYETVKVAPNRRTEKKILEIGSDIVQRRLLIVLIGK